MNQEKKKNPLYVVTNKGRDVEAAETIFDALVKRFGLGPIFKFLDEILEELLKNLLAQISSYALLVAAQKMLSEMIYQFELFLAKLGYASVPERVS